MFSAQSTSQRIVSGLKETFIKRYIVERTKKAEIRRVGRGVGREQSEKTEFLGGFMERSTVERAIKTEIDTRTEAKKGVGKLGWYMSRP